MQTKHNKTWHRKFMESWLALTREGTLQEVRRYQHGVATGH
jgi:hypothetical protein